MCKILTKRRHNREEDKKKEEQIRYRHFTLFECRERSEQNQV